jgi:transcriptional regulator with XRE-family HTH domain
MSKTEKIKILLLKKGLKQRDLVKKLKKSKSEISNAIAGRKRPVLQEEIFDYLKSL